MNLKGETVASIVVGGGTMMVADIVHVVGNRDYMLSWHFAWLVT